MFFDVLIVIKMCDVYSSEMRLFAGNLWKINVIRSIYLVS